MNNNICFVVGRSGGHIFPAIAIADQIKKLSPQALICFIHSGTSLEKNIFSGTKYSSYELSAGSIQGQSFFKQVKTLLQIPVMFIRSFILLRRIEPQVVIGTGGAVTGSVLVIARLLKKKTAIWEGNVVFGLSNKLLIPFVDKVFTVFKHIPNLSESKQIHCGYPLRSKVTSSLYQKKETSLFNVFICGGSQGSSLLNSVVSQAVCDPDDWRKDILIFHQCGEIHFPKMKHVYSSLKRVEVFGFNPSIENYYAQADLIFSRSGSGVVAEIASLNKALVLVPLSKSGGGHQLKNALHLYKQKAVELILEEEFNKESFKDIILKLKELPAKRESLASQLNRNYPLKNGSLTIAQWALQK